MILKFCLLLVLVQFLNVLSVNLGCITPFGAEGFRTHITNCTPILKLVQKYPTDMPTEERKFIRQSFREEDKVLGIVCCRQDMNVTQAFQSVGAEILRNHANVCGDSINKRISFGTEVTLMKYPWSALMVYDTAQRFHCGGTLVTNRYVLTAAHCVQNYLPLIGVRLREHNISSEVDCALAMTGELVCAAPVVDVGIEKVIIHADYSTVTFDNDIALVRMERAIHYERSIRPICLPEVQQEEFSAPAGIVTGWGATQNSMRSTVLMEAEVPIFELKHCQKIYLRHLLDDTKICASGENAVDVCKGDSGGPLFVRLEGFQVGRKFRYMQVGIISLGTIKCGEIRGLPAVFTRIAAYVDWLQEKLEL